MESSVACESVASSSGTTSSQSEGVLRNNGITDRKGEILRAPRAALTIADFEVEKSIGSGSFAQVLQAKLIQTGQSYALKVMDKRHIVKEGKAEYALLERKTLNCLKNDGIVNLCFTFQDSNSLYLGLELCPGHELFDQIQERGRIPVEDARFYAAEVVLVLEYLHNLGIVHRDLKPENLLLTETGHLKLADFGSVKILQPMDQIELGIPYKANTYDSSRKTSFVGTAEYASPEVLSGGAASPAMDWWAFGCLLFQMIVGKPPFRGGTEYLTFQKIQEMDYTVPGVAIIPLEAADLVRKLLLKEPTERLGMGQDGVDGIKNHPFFKDIDWENIRSMKAPDFVEPSNHEEEDDVDFLEIVPTEGNFDAIRNIPQNLLWDKEDHQEEDHAKEGKLAHLVREPDDTSKNGLSWESYLERGENAVMTGCVKKYKGVFYRTRLLVLTDKPRLFYLDPSTFEMKGEIALPRNVVTKQKNNSTFTVQNEHKTYVIEDPAGKAGEWIEAISESMMFPQSPS